MDNNPKEKDKLSAYDQKFINKIREENHLKLRKAKLNKILMNKRLNPSNNNDNSCQYKINQQVLNNKLPSVLLTEFDNYEGKYDLILQYLNEDYSSLSNTQFNKEDVVLFTLMKIGAFFHEERALNPLLDSLSYEAQLYKSLLNILMTSSNMYILYEITGIFINYCSDSEQGAYAMLNDRLWKRLYELTLLNSIDLTSNIIWLFTNIMAQEEIVLKICSTINFNQLLLDYMTATKDNFSYYKQGITLLNNFFILNKKEFVLQEAFLYPNLFNKYQDEISLITVKPQSNDIIIIEQETKEDANRRILIEEMTEVLFKIVTVEGEHTSLFFGESFLFSIIKLIKAFVTNSLYKNYLESISLIYRIISNLIERGSHEQIIILNKQGFLPVTELLISTIVMTPECIRNNCLLLANICFCLSNYVADYSNDVIEGNFLPDIMKAAEFLREREDFICELLYTLYNAILEGNSYSKQRIIAYGFDYLLSHINLNQTDETALMLSLKILIKMIAFARSNDSIQLLKQMRTKIDNVALIDSLEKFEHCQRQSIEELATQLKEMINSHNNIV